ncbi:30S ribosomal protein S6e [Candidatus Woesearchaeota archaeon]|nr:30S ribosomal protein S6e [Candidatus Woesearchaeota archaeon]
MKLVISNKEGKAKQVEIELVQERKLYGSKIGEEISGDSIGFEGYTFSVRGGSDSSGFPMRRDVQGQERKRILTTSSLGNHLKRKGMRTRKSVRGNTVSDSIAQLNLFVVKEGSTPLFEEPKEEAPAEEAPKEE